ncbi:TcpH protein [Aliivibrio finisterrensis]|uniref:TcpH protein n=1 Tax=Aliivibrio finisterrensis TaxID=511998 RepID=A0A4Q5KWS5_9GAMM|nr:TcpH protein [Aliivibrio finisterrensis]RYU53396.1 TcpH protein [Aliivibrio finisterrensis]RYU58483.1 TcpH protein [Aliivibrio finisterrensis]RYU65902.1 TcpH protein [Aliivibrio finisterrensis]RYU84197.1 TcpH protein [Aliivibrio finisterrensis]
MRNKISKILLLISAINFLIIIVWHNVYRVDLSGTITINDYVKYTRYIKYLDSVEVLTTYSSDDCSVSISSDTSEFVVNYDLSQGQVYAHDGSNYYILNIYSLGDYCFVTLPAGSKSLKKIGFFCTHSN